MSSDQSKSMLCLHECAARFIVCAVRMKNSSHALVIYLNKEPYIVLSLSSWSMNNFILPLTLKLNPLYTITFSLLFFIFHADQLTGLIGAIN